MWENRKAKPVFILTIFVFWLFFGFLFYLAQIKETLVPVMTSYLKTTKHKTLRKKKKQAKVQVSGRNPRAFKEDHSQIKIRHVIHSNQDNRTAKENKVF